MSMTIGAAAAAAELEKQADRRRGRRRPLTTASALLRGARGNSGVILSLLFRGISQGSSRTRRM